jgi:type VI secretion system secreted protein VgrG
MTKMGIDGGELLDFSRALTGQPGAFGRELELSLSPLTAEQVRVVGFKGREAVSSLYELEILFFTLADSAVDPVASCLGQRARLWLPTTGEDGRCFHGLARRVELVAANEERKVYRVLVVPELWLLTQTRDSRVFQDMTVAEIVAEVLADHGISHLARLSGDYPAKTYCLQYDESDYEFVERALALEGIAFTFEHYDTAPAGVAKAGECMVLFDNTTAYDPISGSPDLVFRRDAGSAMQRGESDVLELRMRGDLAPTVVTLRDYDFDRAAGVAGEAIATPSPGAEPTVTAGVVSVSEKAKTSLPAGPAALEVYDHHGEYVDLEVTRNAARTRVEQHRARVLLADGVALCRRLSPGRSFRLSEHEAPSLDGDYAISEVVHEAIDIAGHEDSRYRCRFACVPKTTLLRPPRPPRRVVQVVETAMVVGPLGEEIHTDSGGCVRVQFRWDREGTHDERSSCWLRVAQPWAGPSFGFQFVPRIGMEVLVGFLGGDPDRPLILGCLPNLASALPHAPPDGTTRSAIRTRSTPGGEGYNEILFDDQSGGELFQLRAQRNFQQTVLADQLVTVGNNQTATIGGAQKLTVAGAQTTEIGGARALTIAENDTVVTKGKVLWHHESDHVSQTDGRAQLQVGAEATAEFGGSLQMVVGSKAPSDLIVSASGTAQMVVKDRLRIASTTKIELVCGSTRLVLTPDGATLDAKSFKVETTDSMQLGVKGTELKLDDKAKLISSEIELVSSGASLLLDSDAWLQGGQVYLNCKKLAAKRNAPTATTNPGKLTFKVQPPQGYTGTLTLVLASPTGEVIEKQTDGNYEVTLDGEDGDSYTLLEVRQGDETLQHLKT